MDWEIKKSSFTADRKAWAICRGRDLSEPLPLDPILLSITPTRAFAIRFLAPAGQVAAEQFA